MTLDLEKFPPTSSSIKLHIRHAYLQAYLWYQAPFIDSIDLDPENYGYVRDDEDLVPIIFDDLRLPDAFPAPCNCLKCARETVCPCRVKDIACCQYCRCGTSCNTPLS